MVDFRAKHATMRAFSMIWKRLRNVLQRMSPVIAGTLVLALLLRWILRDSSRFTAPLFYALPLPLHASGWLSLAVLWWRHPKRWRPRVCTTVAGLMGILWIANTRSLRRETAAPGDPGPRVFFWNIGHTRAVPAALHELLNELQPDAAALAESEKLESAEIEELGRRHPDFQLLRLPDGMVCMVKGRATVQSSRNEMQKFRLHLIRAEFTRFPGDWRICLADIGWWPLWPRDASVAKVFEVAAGHPRTIVAGDFNTPLESSAFDSWRGNFHHGLADCRAWRGSLETWPYGIPLLAIDHIWMSRDLVPANADKGARWGKDHSWLVVECAFQPGPSAK